MSEGLYCCMNSLLGLLLGPNGRATEPFLVQLFVTRPSDHAENEAWPGDKLRSLSYDEFDHFHGGGLSPLNGEYDLESSFSSFDFSLDKAQQAGGGEAPNFPTDLEQLLYVVRRKLLCWRDVYICSFSSRVI